MVRTSRKIARMASSPNPVTRSDETSERLSTAFNLNRFVLVSIKSPASDNKRSISLSCSSIVVELGHRAFGLAEIIFYTVYDPIEFFFDRAAEVGDGVTQIAAFFHEFSTGFFAFIRSQ